MGFKCWKENEKKEREFNKMAKICREQKESEDMVSAIHDILNEEFKKTGLTIAIHNLMNISILLIIKLKAKNG